MPRTDPRTRRPRDRHQSEALFHIQAGGSKILNLRHIPGDISAAALFTRGIARVDRATPWGNPFPISPKYGDRAEVVERYRRHLWQRIRTGDIPLEALAALSGKPLPCWCWPRRPCHAEVLARAASWATRELEKKFETSRNPRPHGGSSRSFPLIKCSTRGA